MKKALILLISSITAISCVQQQQIEPETYGVFHGKQKTMAVPSDNIEASRYLKNELRNRGWELNIHKANTGAEQKGKFSLTRINGTSRYTMLYSYEPVWDRLWGWYVPHTTVTIYDNTTGKEILSHDGQFYLTEAECKKIIKSIEANTL